MKNRFLTDETEILILDGAMGTMLQRYSPVSDGNNDRLNIEAPDVIARIHREYMDAGADIIETNTFSSNSISQQEYGLSDKAADMAFAGAAIARKAADEYAALADTYEEMELFELSAAAWFQYLDVCAEEEVVDGYEGLSACFYNLGNEGLASYYYKKMLADKYVTPENNTEMGELFEHAAAAQTAPRVRITWPPEHADYSQELDAGLRLLRKGDHEGAEREFLKIHPGSSYYAEACNYLAVSYLLSGKTDKAEECCLAALKEKPDSVQTLATYAAVLSEMDRKEESARIAHKLSLLPAEEPDELYKIATVCCENGLYEAAYEKFCKLEKIVGYDRTMLYFKGVAAFRCGKVKEFSDKHIRTTIQARRFAYFEPEYYTLYIYGLCSKCRQKKRGKK